MQQITCSCNSHKIYAGQSKRTFCLSNHQMLPQTRFLPSNINRQSISKQILCKVQGANELWLPPYIPKVQYDELITSPHWFYREFISKNTPVIITGCLSGSEICQNWSSPKYLSDTMKDQTVSMSLTPDGFADSIKNKYFVQPQEILTNIKGFIDSQEEFPNCYPYIQHQNDNLNKQFKCLNQQLPKQTLQFISENFFQSNQPQANNIWLGTKNSVSSIHKDFYENFYTTIVGQKHFTLVPPTGILRMEQYEYENGKWSYDRQCHQFSVVPGEGHTKWIACNPDLQSDSDVFEMLGDLRKYHVVVGSGDMLYLPSLWYHQVAQQHQFGGYCLAVNYWYDMKFTQNYSLYQLCRAIKNI